MFAPTLNRKPMRLAKEMSYLRLTEMAKRNLAIHKEFSTVEDVNDAARTAITNATRLPIHQKPLVIVSDDQDRIAWAAASDGWQTDYRPGFLP